ncbi:MAG: amino acid ABC transporter permease [Gammaproteobacteria bacterium]|jgi:general L-amino acid transport system permease protein|nr:amino acid ABC transporter permease [Gammaproteobacteria bacterium]MBT4132653.1 amino acid ABC transporter permease [Candidatus Neomarinimicrobiota bacterium]MBT7308437.1 amino acid ABC transporter permease [Gammaproteobacteria bacterium]
MVKLWRNSQVRGWAFQLLALTLFGYLGWSLWDNLQTNLTHRGISTGFGFLDTEAGFGIISHLIEYSESSTYGRAFLVGLLNTLLVTFVGIVLATLLGLILGVARLSNNWLISRLAQTYVEVIRNIPLLLQIFFWYFAVLRSLPSPRQSIHWGELFFLNNRGAYLPAPIAEPGSGWAGWALLLAILVTVILFRWARLRQHQTGKTFPRWRVALGLMVALPLLALAVKGFPLGWELPELKGFNFKGGWVMIPELMALVTALSLYTASYIAEIVRAGIQAVNRGQSEAAQSLGLSQGQTLRLIILPQALRVIIPPLTNQYLNLLKNSSLAAAIAYPEVVSVFAGTVLNQTGQAVEVIGITMGVYLLISLSISLFMNRYNRRMKLVER